MVLQAVVQPEASKAGFTLFVQNTGTQSVEVIICNPYTSTCLLSPDGIPLGKCMLFTWEQRDPHIILHQGHSVIASIKIYPLWDGICSDVRARTHLKWRFLGSEEVNTLWVEG